MNENTMTVIRTPETVGAEIRSLTATAKAMTLYYGIEIGRRLAEAKELVPHGGWLDWLDRETEFSQPTANRFMRLFAEYGADQQSLFGVESKYSALNNISISNALRLLAVPEEERESFAAEVDAEHISSRDLEAAIRERDEARKALAESDEGHALAMAEAQANLDEAREDARKASQKVKEMQERETTFRQELAEAEKELKDLRERPVEVAVERDEKAIAEAVKEAEKKAAKDLAALRKSATELENAASKEQKALKDQIAELEKKLAKAKTAAADTSREQELSQAREEISALRKQLAMSGAEVAGAKVLFAAWQEAYARLQAAVEAAPEEAREKLLSAVRAQAGRWAEGR